MLFLLLAACAGETTSELPSGPERCLQDRVAVSPEDTTLGFSAEDVIDLMRSSPSVEMAWDYAIFDLGARGSVSVGGLDGEASLVSVPAGAPCEAFSAALLAVPTQFTVTLADGGLVGTFTEEVFADAATAPGVHLWDSETGQDWAMRVSADLEPEIRDWLSTEHGVTGDPEVVLWFGGTDSTWQDGALAVEIRVEEQAFRAWDGAWTL